MKKQTARSFIELLKKHGILGPYILIKDGNLNNVCIDGWIDLEKFLKELNGE